MIVAYICYAQEISGNYAGKPEQEHFYARPIYFDEPARDSSWHLLGIWNPLLGFIGATGMGGLMLAAVAMHMKVRDPVKKALPAAALLVLSLVVAVSASAA